METENRKRLRMKQFTRNKLQFLEQSLGESLRRLIIIINGIILAISHFTLILIILSFISESGTSRKIIIFQDNLQ